VAFLTFIFPNAQKKPKHLLFPGFQPHYFFWKAPLFWGQHNFLSWVTGNVFFKEGRNFNTRPLFSKGPLISGGNHNFCFPQESSYSTRVHLKRPGVGQGYFISPFQIKRASNTFRGQFPLTEAFLRLRQPPLRHFITGGPSWLSHTWTSRHCTLPNLSRGLTRPLSRKWQFPQHKPFTQGFKWLLLHGRVTQPIFSNP